MVQTYDNNFTLIGINGCLNTGLIIRLFRWHIWRICNRSARRQGTVVRYSILKDWSSESEESWTLIIVDDAVTAGDPLYIVKKHVDNYTTHNICMHAHTHTHTQKTYTHTHKHKLTSIPTCLGSWMSSRSRSLDICTSLSWSLLRLSAIFNAP